MHGHRCKRCSKRWRHSDVHMGDTCAHRCTRCGAVTWEKEGAICPLHGTPGPTLTSTLMIGAGVIAAALLVIPMLERRSRRRTR